MSALKLVRTNKAGEQKIQGVMYIPHKEACTLLNVSHKSLVDAIEKGTLPEKAMPLRGYATINGSRLYPKDAIVELAMNGYRITKARKGRSFYRGNDKGGVNERKKFSLAKERVPFEKMPRGYLRTGDFIEKWDVPRSSFYHILDRVEKEGIPEDLKPLHDGFAYYWHPDFIKIIKEHRYIENLDVNNTEVEEAKEEEIQEESAKIEFQSVKEGSKILLKYQDTEGNEFEQVLPLGTSLMLSIEKAEE